MTHKFLWTWDRRSGLGSAMDTSQPIRALLESPEGFARLRDILASETFRSRAAAGPPGLRGAWPADALGRPRLANCDAALRELGRRCAAGGLAAVREAG